MEKIELETAKRNMSTKGELNDLRRAGFVPGILYGGNETPQAITVKMKELLKLLERISGTSAILELTIDGQKSPAIIKNVQRDVLSRKPIHVDFQRILMTQKIEVVVPINVTGEAIGVKSSGGTLDQILREVKIRCLPGEIPQAVTVDVSHLNIHDSITVKSLALGPNVEVLTSPDNIVVHVLVPKVEAAPEPAAATVVAAEGSTPSQPEVITKGKKEEEATPEK